MTGLLAEPPREAPPPPRRVFTKKQLAFRYLWIAAVIMAGSMFALWALSPVWDPFHVKRQGTFEAYGDALPWIAGIVLVVQALVAMVDRARRGEPILPDETSPTAQEEDDPDMEPVGTWLKGLARFLAWGFGAIGVLALVLGIWLSAGTANPNSVLATDAPAAGHALVLIAALLWAGAGLLWWAGHDR